jgi:hypothetical protein
VFDATSKAKELESEIERKAAQIKKLSGDNEAFREAIKAGISVTIGNRKFDDAEQANEALARAVTQITEARSAPYPLGEAWGFKLYASWPSRFSEVRYYLSSGDVDYGMGKATVESARQTLYGIKDRIAKTEAEIADAKESIPRLQESAKAPFARAADLAKKRTMLADLETDIQANPIPAPAWLRSGAPVNTEVFVGGKPVVVEGHRWTKDGYLVTVSEEGKPARDVDYQEVKDDNGLPMYEARPFAAPVVQEATSTHQDKARELFAIKSALTKVESPEQIFGKVEEGRLKRGEKRDSGERKSVSTEMPKFKEDLGSPSWLQEQIDYAKERGRNRWGVPYMGKITGSFKGNISVPMSILEKLPGQRGEQQAVREKSLEYIRRNWDEVSKEPPYIEVAYNGEAWVSEGNHRIIVAKEKGLDSLPVEIRYFDGGQKVDGPLSPEKLLGAGEFSPERASILNDLATAPAAAFSSTPEEVRANALARLKSLERKREAGKITEAEYRLGVQQLIGKLEQRNDAREERRMESGRRRGADWIVSQLRRGVADQAIPRNEADFAEWLLSQNPNLANDLGISMSAKDGNGTRGNYNPLARIIKLFTSANLGEGTAVHEILHHTERMMPGDVQAGVLKAWQKARDAAYKGADDKTKAALDDMLAASLGDVKAHQRTLQAFDKGALNYDQHYQLYSPSEFWAVNASRILSGRFEAKGAWVQRAIQWFKEFVQRVKGMLGLKSDAPILKALDAVMRGEGVFQPKAQMLAERVAEPSASGEIQYNDIVRKTQNNLVQFFGNQKDSVKTFNWFNKRLSTQFHKALKDRDFGRVFGFANAMQNHVSIAAIRPAELAPGVLPRVDDVKSALKTVWKGKQASADLDGAAKAVFAGTLNGANVMQGKVFSDDELRSQFKLTDTGVALYKQARAAIDASLDELAASEAFAMAQGFVPKAMRRPLIDNPQAAPGLLDAELRKQIKMLKAAIKTAAAANNEEQRAQLEASLEAYTNTARTVEKIFVTAKNLKAAGYAPLMRFGKYTVTVQAIDPATGNLLRDENGESVTEFYGQYETEGEMKAARDQKAAEYKDRDDVRLTTGIKSQNAHELYAGISPETLALFSDAIGAGDTMKKYYQLALSERSALKRRLERKGTAGFSEDMPRVLSNFITSNARFASQRYYMRDLNNAIKFIPKEKGDVLDEAIALKKFMDNPNDAGAAVSSAMFAWFLGGSVASATINLTQPIMMTAPYLSQHGVGRATAAMAKAMPYALGKKQITDADLRAALKRASQEGVVDAQEIFHLYGLGAQSVASGLTNALAKVPGVGGKIKAGGESARARVNAFLTLWGSMFSLAEGFNRKLTFIAAWEVAKAKGEKDPFAFAVRAVNETQGIYNKVNRPNWARGPVGRTVLTFKQFGIMYIELLSRMWKRGGPEGKRAALMMLAVLMLAAGEEGLPFAQDLDDLIDTIGQGFGLDTNMRRNKRRLAHEIFGKTMGDLSMYGISSQLPLDFSGRMGMGNLIPASGIAKPSDKNMMGRNVAELFGPAAGMASQIGDAYEAFTEGNKQKALANLAPKAVKDVLSGLEMADKGYATDAVGRKTTDVTAGEAAIKAVGFNPTKVAELTRKTMPIQQDVALQRITESAILDQWVRGITDNDSDMVEKAQAKLEEWNRANPDTPIQINAGQIRSRIRNQGTDKETRILKSTPKEMRGRAAEGLDMVE